jgi:hypothetical protein
LGPKLDDSDLKLIGYGISGVLISIIILGVELFNGSPPSISSLKSFSGHLVEQHITQDRNRTFADLRVRNGTQDVILFQQVSKKLSGDIEKLSSGVIVTAFIESKDFKDTRTGLTRHSMWQLAINQQELFSYDEITQYINNQTRSWRKFAYLSGAVAIGCFIVVGLRISRRAQ